MAHLKLNTKQWLQLGKKLGYIKKANSANKKFLRIAQEEGGDLQGKYGRATENSDGNYLYLGLDIVYDSYPTPHSWVIGMGMDDGPDAMDIDSAETPEECIKIMDDYIESEILDENETGLSEQELEKRIEQWVYDNDWISGGGDPTDNDIDTRTLDEQQRERDWDSGGYGGVHRAHTDQWLELRKNAQEEGGMLGHYEGEGGDFQTRKYKDDDSWYVLDASGEPVDAYKTEAEADSAAKAMAESAPDAGDREKSIEFLVRGGMPTEQAEEWVEKGGGNLDAIVEEMYEKGLTRNWIQRLEY